MKRCSSILLLLRRPRIYSSPLSSTATGICGIGSSTTDNKKRQKKPCYYYPGLTTSINPNISSKTILLLSLQQQSLQQHQQRRISRNIMSTTTTTTAATPGDSSRGGGVADAATASTDNKKRKLSGSDDEEDDGGKRQPGTSRSTTSENDNDNDDSDGNKVKDRKNNNNNNNNKNSRRKNNNKTKGKKRDRPTWGDEDERGRKSVHPGSYANPTLRAMMGVELPQHAQAGVAAAAAAAAAVAQGGGTEVESINNNSNKNDNNNDGNEPKMAKRKVAFMLGYLGKGYGGFQMNEEQRTLQGEFELALLKCKLLSAQNFGYPFKYGWSTSGRTDKGVHACAQVCSCKIHLPEDLDEVRERINSNLPSDQFQVLDIVRTTRSFCAKTQRDRVRYQYMIPSFALTDVKELRQIYEKAGLSNIDTSGRSAMDALTEEEVAKIRPAFQNVRATSQQLDRLQAALKKYEGTHSFHNFTKGVKSTEGRASRYIISFQIEKPLILDGIEWIPTQVLGQSFLLHQIRKMVSLAIDVGRNAAPLETIDKLLSKETETRLNTAPAQGLFLEMSYYNGYNSRKQTNTELKDIDWDCETSQAHARWKEFREKVIMQHIASEEQRESNFLKYLFMQEHYFDYNTFYKLSEEKDNNKAANDDQAS